MWLFDRKILIFFSFFNLTKSLVHLLLLTKSSRSSCFELIINIKYIDETRERCLDTYEIYIYTYIPFFVYLYKIYLLFSILLSFVLHSYF